MSSKLLLTCPSMIIKTGNTVNWEILKRSAGQTATEELEQCLNVTIDSWLESNNSKIKEKDCQKEIVINKSSCKDNLKCEERNELKITVKIFLKEANEQLVSDALETTIDEMGICSVETVILSFKPVSDENVYLDSLKKLWKVLECFVKKGVVYTLGVCDLNINHLQTLYEWAEIKPIINQMNLANCCVIPPEMSQYAQNKEIQLLTHSDPAEILSDEALQELLVSKFATHSSSPSSSPSSQPSSSDYDWKVEWVSRYSVLIKCRGIIKSKGFAVKAKNSKK